MRPYVVAHPYTARRDGVTFGPWAAGDQVELADGDAAWVERDSPGALTPVQAATEQRRDDTDVEAAGGRQAKKPADRQARGGRNRSA